MKNMLEFVLVAPLSRAQRSGMRCQNQMRGSDGKHIIIRCLQGVKNSLHLMHAEQVMQNCNHI